jgi:hypothetical protein
MMTWPLLILWEDSVDKIFPVIKRDFNYMENIFLIFLCRIGLKAGNVSYL